MRRVIAFLVAWLCAFNAVASPLTLLGVSGSVSAAAAFDITYITNGVSATCPSTCGFTLGLGTDVTGSDVRWTIIVPASTSNVGRTLASVTLCGAGGMDITATEVTTDISGTSQVSVFVANTTGRGTSCLINMSATSSIQNAGMAIFRMINPVSSTPDGNSCNATLSGAAESISFNILSSGKAVVASSANSTTDRTATWSGTAGPTEQYDLSTELGMATMTGAIAATAGSPVASTVTYNTAPTSSAETCGASWH